MNPNVVAPILLDSTEPEPEAMEERTSQRSEKDDDEGNIVEDDTILARIVEESVDLHGQVSPHILARVVEETDDLHRRANHHIVRKKARIEKAMIAEESLFLHGQANQKEDGRIVSLSIGPTFAAPFDHHFALSPTIHKLDALESLTLTACWKLPQDIVRLRKLRKLTLINCKRLETIPSLAGMDQLEELRFLGFAPMIPPYILERIKSLSDLQVLQFAFHPESEELELLYLQAMLNPSLRFAPSLRELNLNRCHISNAGFRLILSPVLPNFPHLKVLSLCHNNISSFRGIASLIDDSSAQSSIGNHETRLHLPSLEQLILSENPIWSSSEGKIKVSNDEREALALFLKNSAPRLSYLGYRFEMRSSLRSPEVQFWLDVNKMGRWLIDPHQSPDQYYRTDLVSVAVESAASAIDRCPIAIWPTILSRANLHFNQNANSVQDDVDGSGPRSLVGRQSSTIYYLLRHGPALMG